MSYKDNSKPWFETGDYPTQEQFWQVFEWLRWRDENIPISEIVGLQSILNGLATPVEFFQTDGSDLEYTIPVGFLLEKVILKPASDCTASCEYEGTSNPGDIISDQSISHDNGAVWSIDIYSPNTEIKIILPGLPNGSSVYFIKRKLA